MRTFIKLIILIIIIFLIYQGTQIFKRTKITTNKIPNKYTLWSYWELKPGNTSPPPYIQLCFDTFNMNGAKNFDVRILNDQTVYDYLPDLRTDLNRLGIAAKSDYIRIRLLKTYGGVWLDADTILMGDLSELVDKLKTYDFIGFGATGKICKTSGYPRPSNGAMGANPGCPLLELVLKKLDEKLDETSASPDTKFGYFDLGKKIIWEAIDELNYDYYHWDSSADGSRDIDGNWVAPDLIFKKDIKLLDPNKLLFVFLANSIYCSPDPKYNWFCKLNKEKILSGDYFVSKLFRRALDL